MGELILKSEVTANELLGDLSRMPTVKSIHQLKGKIDPVYCIGETDTHYHIPFRYAREKYPTRFPLCPVTRAPRSFTGRAKNPDQQRAFDEGLTIFSETNSVLLECRTGFGKTLFSAYLWDHTDSIAVVMITIKAVVNSWVNTFVNFFNIDPEEVHIVGERKKRKLPARVYICMCEQVYKLDLPKDRLVTAIVDEGHLWCTSKRFNRLLSLRADYFIGCSATMQRPDGHEELFYKFSGERSVVRRANIPHIFCEFKTGIKFDVVKNSKNEVDFNAIKKSLSVSEERNNLIIDIIMLMSRYDRKILVMGHFTEHLDLLYKMLKARENAPRTQLFYKDDKTFEDCDVLIGTQSKLSTGFDYEQALNGKCTGTISIVFFINTIATETTYEQAKGRGMRGENPLMVMLSDSNKILEKHIRTNRGYRQSTRSIETVIDSLDALKTILDNPLKTDDDDEW